MHTRNGKEQRSSNLGHGGMLSSSLQKVHNCHSQGSHAKLGEYQAQPAQALQITGRLAGVRRTASRCRKTRPPRYTLRMGAWGEQHDVVSQTIYRSQAKEPDLEDVGQLIVTLHFRDALEAVGAIVEQHSNEKAIRPERKVPHSDPRQYCHWLVHKGLSPRLQAQSTHMVRAQYCTINLDHALHSNPQMKG